MDLLDRASEQEQKTTNIMLASITAKVSNMHRPSNGSGICADCGELIPRKRLEAIPGATRCVRCQMVFEKEEE